MKITWWRGSPSPFNDIDHPLKLARVLLILVGAIIIFASLYDITTGIPHDQALLNQGAVMCNGIPMSVNDRCPVTECHTESMPGLGTSSFCQTTGEKTRDQQKKITQQNITNGQQNDPAVAIPIGIMFFLVGIALFWWEFREQKQSRLRNKTYRYRVKDHRTEG